MTTPFEVSSYDRVSDRKSLDVRSNDEIVTFAERLDAELRKHAGKVGCAASDYARSGIEATATVVQPAGALVGTPPSMIDQLRNCGLPVTLKQGTIHVDVEYTVCKEGDTLTPEQCQLLKHFDHKLARFEVTLTHVWHDDEVRAL